MKNELEKFDRKRIEEIQAKYRVTEEKNINPNPNYFGKLKEQTLKYQKALFYKNKLDAEEIKEEQIPDEYIEEIRKIYYEEIGKFEMILKSK